MRFLSLTTAAALALAGGMAAAQTTTTENSQDNPPHFGETWGSTVGSQFFTDDTMGTLRSEDEIRNAWQSMTQEQQAMVMADCDLAKAGGTDAAATGTGTDSSATTTGTSTDSSSTTTGTSTDSSTTTGSSSGSDAAAATATYVSPDNMTKLCEIIAP